MMDVLQTCCADPGHDSGAVLLCSVAVWVAYAGIARPFNPLLYLVAG